VFTASFTSCTVVEPFVVLFQPRGNCVYFEIGRQAANIIGHPFTLLPFVLDEIFGILQMYFASYAPPPPFPANCHRWILSFPKVLQILGATRKLLCWRDQKRSKNGFANCMVNRCRICSQMLIKVAVASILPYTAFQSLVLCS
jgi:hypothetical protein